MLLKKVKAMDNVKLDFFHLEEKSSTNANIFSNSKPDCWVLLFKYKLLTGLWKCTSGDDCFHTKAGRYLNSKSVPNGVSVRI